MMRCLSLLFAVLAMSCRPSAPSTCGDANASPTNAEVLAYLEDKPLPLARPCAIRLEGIEALSVRRGGVRSAAGPWATAISFIYNTARARYAVEAVVEHETIGAQRVFHAFKTKSITRC